MISKTIGYNGVRNIFRHTQINESTQCEAPKIAKLVYNSNVTMVYGTYNYSYWGL